jgi:2-polyprenyl-3-methyl-5-hydroxy-6-metoxy-1,4-benzoquinol methylase
MAWPVTVPDEIDRQMAFLCLECGGRVPLIEGLPDGSLPCTSCGRVYARKAGVVVVSEGDPSATDQPDEYYPLMVDIESRHFWFGARANLIIATLREAMGSLAGRSVLDIGCGTGFVLAALERAGMRGCGLDIHRTGLHFARQRVRGPIVCSSAQQPIFGPQFDVALLCDVIEHVHDDVGLLRAAGQTLRPGGLVLVTVPAYPRLWTALDDVSAHKRRYVRGSLTKALQAAGLEITLVRYFNTLLFPVQVLQRSLHRSSPIATAADRERVVRQAMRVPPAPLNAVLKVAAWADLPLRRLAPPFGASLIAVARRPPESAT